MTTPATQESFCQKQTESFKLSSLQVTVIQTLWMFTANLKNEFKDGLSFNETILGSAQDLGLFVDFLSIGSVF